MSPRPRSRARPSKRPIINVYSSADKKCGRRAVRAAQTDGPPPPRNTMQRKNAADHFWNEHQEEHEARARSSAGRARAVRDHCGTYPQLKDLLRKRRSDAKPVREARLYSAAELCAQCRRLCRGVGRRGPPRAPSRPRGIRKAKRPRTKAAHLTRRPKVRRNVLTVYRKPYFSSDSTVYSLESLKGTVGGEKQEPDAAQRSRDADSEVSRITELKTRPAPSKASAVTGAVSPASGNSMSSYHSFGSMGQPPTV